MAAGYKLGLSSSNGYCCSMTMLQRDYMTLPELLTAKKDMCRVKAMQAGLQTKESCWYLLRLCNLTTIQREWCALHAFPKLPFRATLLSATAPEKPQEHALVIPEVILPDPCAYAQHGRESAVCLAQAVQIQA